MMKSCIKHDITIVPTAEQNCIIIACGRYGL